MWVSFFKGLFIAHVTLQMEQISNKARNLQMNLLMGKLYRYARNHRSAVSCYKECLRFVSDIVLCHLPLS